MKIPQVKPSLGDSELSNLQETIENRWITEGKFSEEFRERVRDRTGADHVYLTNNGTLSLYMGLLALGVGKGDEVIVPDLTFYSSASVVTFTGAKPVFVDVNEETFQFDPDAVEDTITDSTAAVMPVHLYGQAGEMSRLQRIADRHELSIIEDAAQGFGVEYNGDHLGTLGDIGIFSLYADKTITTGEGGIIITDDDALGQRLKELKNFGRTTTGTYIHPALGMNFRFTDLQAAIGVAQLDKFSSIRASRRENYRYFQRELKDIPEVRFMTETQKSTLVPFRTPLIVKRRNSLANYLEDNGIETRQFFYPLHRQPAFDYLEYPTDSFPRSNRLYESGICLPVYPELQKKEISYICEHIRDFYA